MGFFACIMHSSEVPNRIFETIYSRKTVKNIIQQVNLATLQFQNLLMHSLDLGFSLVFEMQFVYQLFCWNISGTKKTTFCWFHILLS